MSEWLRVAIQTAVFCPVLYFCYSLSRCGDESTHPASGRL